MRDQHRVSRRAQVQVLDAPPYDAKSMAFAEAASRAWSDAKAMAESSAADVAEDFSDAMRKIAGAIVEYEHSSERHIELRGFIDTLGPRIARKRGFPRDLILAAHANLEQWPTWAVECLPSLFVRDEPRPGERGRAFVWRYLLDCVDPERQSITRELCGGCVFEVEPSDEMSVLLDRLAPTFEECRLRRPYSNLQSIMDGVGRILDELIAQGVPCVTTLRQRLLRGLYLATLSVEPERRQELEQERQALETRPVTSTFPEWALSTLNAD